MNIRSVCSVILLIFVFSSCNQFGNERIKGSGNVTTQTRKTANFSGIDVSGGIDVYFKQNEQYSVQVKVDDNLQEFIEVEESDGILHIKQRNNTSLSTVDLIKVYVTAPSADKFYASGACNFIGESRVVCERTADFHLSGSSNARFDIKAPRITADLSGATVLELKGETRDFEVDGSGSTDLKCFDLMTENTKVELSGAGTAEVYASVKLDVETSGAADIKYKGNASVSKEVSGAGRVNKVD